MRGYTHNQHLGGMTLAVEDHDQREALIETPGPDMCCPELEGRFPGDNFWRKSCVAKQLSSDGACRSKRCAEGLKQAMLFGKIPKIWIHEPGPVCPCGKPSMTRQEMRFIRCVPFPCCRDCHQAERERLKALQDAKAGQKRAKALAEKKAKKRTEELRAQAEKIQKELEKLGAA